MRRLLAVLTGYKTEPKTLQKEVYLYSIKEASIQNSIIHRRLRLFAGAETDRCGVARRDLWATPGMPPLCLVGVDVEWIRGRFFDVAVFEIISSMV